MPTDFQGPSELMGQQLSGVLQMAAETAANRRANVAMQQLQRQQMAQEMETNFNLAKQLYPVSKELSMDYFNQALLPMGRKITMEYYDVGMKIFEMAADAKLKGDPVAMAGFLKKAEPYMVNLGDIQKLEQMKSENQRLLGQQQAQAIQGVQPMSPAVERAKRIVEATSGNAAPLAPGTMAQLTGTDDPALQQDWIRSELPKQEAIWAGYQAQGKAMATLFAQSEPAFTEAAKVAGHVLGNPEAMGKGRLGRLLEMPAEQRTEEEEREMTSLAFLWGPPSLQEALNIKSAQRERDRILSELGDTRDRQAALKGNLETDGAATAAISTLDAKTEHLPDKTANMTEDHAKQHLLSEGIIDNEAQAYLLNNGQTIQKLQQEAATAQEERKAVVKRKATTPGDKTFLERKERDLDATIEANDAMVRLLTGESPYAIAELQSKIERLDPAEQDQEQPRLLRLKARREADLKLVQNEQARLARREAILQGRVPAADRKAEEEQKMRDAIQGVIAQVAKGVSQPKAVSDVAKTIGVDASNLSKAITEYRGAGVVEAQVAFGGMVQKYRADHGGEEPSPAQLDVMARKVSKQFEVKNEDVLAGYNAARAHKAGGGMDLKDLQASYTNAVNLAARLSGNSGMVFTTGPDQLAKLEMGTIKDPVALGKALRGLAEDQSDLLAPQVKKALLTTAERLEAGSFGAAAPTMTPAPAAPPADREKALREKLGLKPATP